MANADSDLAILASTRPPELSAATSILTTTYERIENIKVYKQQCRDLIGRCVGLMVCFLDNPTGLEDTKAVDLADEITAIVRRIDRKVIEWADLSRLKSFLQQREIKDGIDRLYRDMDAAMTCFNITINPQCHETSKAVRERDKAELREVLEEIVESIDDMKALLGMQSSSKSVEEIMESLQTELRRPSMRPNQEQTFREGLWLLHQKTAKLPPLTDLTGQVTISRDGQTVANGIFNDVIKGEWLDHEPVALRLPLINDAEVQKQFQREVTIWRNLDHPNVVPLYGVARLENDVYSVSPWMANGTSISYVQTHPTADRVRILNEVAAGLEYLHINGVIHGDLRGANILISGEGIAALSNFGLSKFLEDCNQRMSSLPNLNPRWFAPEIIRQSDPLSPQSDVWSFGMLCLELMTGEPPFSHASRDITVLHELNQGKLPGRPGRQVTARGLSDDLWSLMKKCWNKKPNARPTMTAVKELLYDIQKLHIAVTPTKQRSKFSLRRPSTSTSPLDGVDSEPGPFYMPENVHTLASGSLAKAASVTPYQGTIPRLTVVTDSVFPRRTASSLSAPSDLRRSSALPWLEATSISTLIPTLQVQRVVAPLESRQATQSLVPSNSSIHLNSSLYEAVSNPQPIIHFHHSGTVSSGTLEGLIQRLITNPNFEKDVEYREILLTSYTDFTTPEDFFGILARRYSEAETADMEYLGEAATLQNNILMVMTYWLENRHFAVNPQLLWQMRSLCTAADPTKNSGRIYDTARYLMTLIDNRSQNDIPSTTVLLAPGRRIPKTSEMTPHDLAIALTLMEGDKYKAILPTDYIAHLSGQSRASNVEAAYLTNNKIVLWVKQSVLHYDTIESRAQVMKFFVNTAMACRNFRNFSSVTAIANALHSTPIDRLRLTRRELSLQLRQALDDLDDVLDPSCNHRTYRAALREFADEKYRDACIPWIAVHLRELYTTLQKFPATTEIGGVPLINFERYVRFNDRIKEVLHFIPPDLDGHRQQGQLAYLEHQLRKVHLEPNIDEELMQRSITLEAGETRDYRTRKRELRRLGFKSP